MLILDYLVSRRTLERQHPTLIKFIYYFSVTTTTGFRYHSVIPKKITDNIEGVVGTACKDFDVDSFDPKFFDPEMCFHIYQCAMLKFLFELQVGDRLPKTYWSLKSFVEGLDKYWRTNNLLSSKPKNYQEVKDCLKHLCVETSKYCANYLVCLN